MPAAPTSAPASAGRRETVDAILDEGLISHVGFVVDGQPYVIPTLHARIGDTVYVHGSAASRLIRTMGAGVAACLTVTLLDGLVLARSAFHHSMTYRSVVVLGEARPVTDGAELVTVLEAFTNRLVPGRWDEVRGPNRKELKGTCALAMSLDEASAKLRTGPPVDDDEDYELDVWAGVIALEMTASDPAPDPQLRDGIEPSPAVTGWNPAKRA